MGKELKVRPLLWLGIVVLLSGCADVSRVMTGSPTITSTSPQSVYQVQAEPYNGPKARVAVMKFENKTGVYYEASRSGTTIQVVDPSAGQEKTVTVRDPIGEGMREQLITALAQTNAFILLERQALKDIMKEQELGASGRVRSETAPTIGELEGADFLIYGAVTEYLPSQASVAIGGGIGALPRPSDPTVSPGNVFVQILARKAVASFMQQDHVAIDLRIVDARTGRIVNATSVEARPRDLGAALGGMFGETLLGIGGQYQTPIQKAVRACMIKAANWIAENTLKGGVMRSPPASSTSTNITQPLGSIPTQPVTDSTTSGTSARETTTKQYNFTTIVQVQKKLTELGYNPGPVDGIAGPKTKAALKKYQKDKGLAETGEINEATLASLGITE
jgi:curli biogenesis system outer membrane secretion channel CsgG